MPAFRKIPVEIEAIQWTRGNEPELRAFTDSRFYAIRPEDRLDDPDIEAEVFDVLHSTWVGVKNGDWIIRGIEGEFYPCDASVFARTYEETP